MTLAKRIRHNTFWMFGGNIGQNALTFISGIILARILAPEDFGMLVTIQIFTGAAGLIASGGMGEALVQTKELGKKDSHVVYTVQTIICISIFLFFFSISSSFASWFDNALYEDMLRVSALSFLIRPLSNIPTALLVRAQKMKVISLVKLCGLLVSSITSIAFAIYDFKTWSLILGGLAGSFFQMVTLIIISQWRPAIYYKKEIARRLGWFGIKFATIDIILYLRKQLENLITSFQLGAQQVGFLNKGSSLAEMPTKIIVSSAYQTLFRALSSIQDNKDQSQYLYRKSLLLMQAYSWPFYIGLAWLAEPFVVLVYGEKWAFSVPPLQIFCVAALLHSISMFSGAVVAAQNKLGKEIVIQMQATVIKLIAILIGIQWGIFGVACALLPSAIYIAIRLSRLACQSLHCSSRLILDASFPAFCLSAIMLASLFLWDLLLTNHEGWLYLFGTAALGASVYAICFCLIPVPELRQETVRWMNIAKSSISRLPTIKE